MDENREKRKRLRAVLSFVLMAVLLMVLFFAAINIGSLHMVHRKNLLHDILTEYSDVPRGPPE